MKRGIARKAKRVALTLIEGTSFMGLLISMAAADSPDIIVPVVMAVTSGAVLLITSKIEQKIAPLTDQSDECY